MTDSDDGFLARWSRRKRSGGAAPVVAAPGTGPVVEAAPHPEAPADADAPPAPAEDRAQQPAQEVDEAELPDVETLDKDSDYTAFMRAGVPEHLRRAALRKLWRSNPLLANLDGLNDYDEDFTLRFGDDVVKAVKTAYKVGKGFVDDDDAEPAGEGAAASEDGAATGEDEAADAVDAEDPSRDA